MIFAGDVKLSALRKVLNDHAISSEFFHGMLLCPKGILVRSVGPAGLLELEGPCCKEYFEVQSLLYSQFSIC